MRSSTVFLDDLFNNLNTDRLYILRHLSDNMPLWPVTEYFTTVMKNIDKLVELARTGLVELRLVLEMLVLFAHAVHGGPQWLFGNLAGACNEAQQMIPRFDDQIKPLVMLARDHWYDEKVVFCIIKTVSIVCANCTVTNNATRIHQLLKNGVFSYICSIMSKLFSKDPSILSVKRELSFPKYFINPDHTSEVSASRQWLTCINFVQNQCTEESHFALIFAGSRMVLPVTIQALKDFGEDRSLAEKEYDRGTMHAVYALLNVLEPSAKDEFHVEDHKKIIAEHAIVHLLDAFNNQLHFQINQEEDIDESYADAVELFLMCNSIEQPRDLQTTLDLLVNIIAIISCEKLTKYDLDRAHAVAELKKPARKNPPKNSYETALKLVSNLIQSNPKKESRDAILRLLVDLDFVPKLVQVVRKRQGDEKIYLHFLNYASECLLVLAEAIRSYSCPESHEILNQMINFFPLVLPFINSFAKESSSHSQTLVIEVIPLIVSAIAKIKHFSLETLECKTGLCKAYSRILNNLKKKQLSNILEMFYGLTRCHEGSAFLASHLLGVFPALWKKARSDKYKGSVCKKLIINLTLAVHAQVETITKLDDLETLLFEWMEETGEPTDVGALRLSWLIIKNKPAGPLARLLGERDEDSIATIKSLGYLAGRMVSCLEQDPPYKSRFLISLTKCMVQIAKSDPSNDELDLLEDLVVPAMWLLEKRDNDKIIANVKEFIDILH